MQQWFFIEIFFFSLTAWETWKIACKARHWLYVNSETEKKKAYMVLIKHIVPLTLLQQFSHSSWYPYSQLRLLWDLFCMWIWNRAKQSMHVKNQTKTHVQLTLWMFHPLSDLWFSSWIVFVANCKCTWKIEACTKHTIYKLICTYHMIAFLFMSAFNPSLHKHSWKIVQQKQTSITYH